MNQKKGVSTADPGVKLSPKVLETHPPTKERRTAMKVRTLIIIGVALWILIHGALIILEAAAAIADAFGI